MEKNDAEGFIVDFNRTYEKKTELRRICGHRFYGVEDDNEVNSEKKENEMENKGARNNGGLQYFQIGRRTALPVSIVEQRRYSYVSDAVVGALCEGEKSFVAERFDASADDGDLPTVKDEPTRTVEAALEHVENPDYVLLPRTETYDEAVDVWEDEGRLRRLGDSKYLQSEEGSEETDCWLHRYDATPETRGAFVIEDERTTVVQKKGEHALPPTDFSYVVEYEDLNDDLPLTVYFGDETREGDDAYEEFFDIVYRVVLSEPIVCEGGVCRVLCP